MSSPGWVPGTETEGRCSSWPAPAGAWAWAGPAERWRTTWRACCLHSSAGCCCWPTPRSACWAWVGGTGRDAAGRCNWRNWTPRGFQASDDPQGVCRPWAELEAEKSSTDLRASPATLRHLTSSVCHSWFSSPGTQRQESHKDRQLLPQHSAITTHVTELLHLINTWRRINCVNCDN